VGSVAALSAALSSATVCSANGSLLSPAVRALCALATSRSHAATLKSAYGHFFDVAYNPSRGLTPGYGYNPDEVLASFRLLGGRFTALQTLCLTEGSLDLSALPLVS
jgi:hypothetical protein